VWRRVFFSSRKALISFRQNHFSKENGKSKYNPLPKFWGACMPNFVQFAQKEERFQKFPIFKNYKNSLFII
jgi:hypothetical protein